MAARVHGTKDRCLIVPLKGITEKHSADVQYTIFKIMIEALVTACKEHSHIGCLSSSGS